MNSNTTNTPGDLLDSYIDKQERFEERAAIMEFDGQMTRKEAEKWAREYEGN